MRLLALMCLVFFLFVHCKTVQPVADVLPPDLPSSDMQEASTTSYPPVFAQVLHDAQQAISQEISKGIDVPIPKDMGGGYTHEQHKLNYKLMYQASQLYQILGDESYATFVKDMFFEYATLYPTLGKHPTDRSYSTGKLFWQCLNDANWLVYSSEAYKGIYDFLTADERKTLETQLFRPAADFLSIDNPKFFNRVHNHSTWGNAAVGMIGLVMNDEELVQRALYGLQLSEKDDLAKDNDGGFIYEKGESKAGFFAQLDHAFSPDGYYTEGPYYQRYAMTPFMMFAQALHDQDPDLKIFEYRDSVLYKAVFTLLQQADVKGEFFAINDAQKGMSIHASSVITAVNIAYGFAPSEELISVASKQNAVLLNDNGLALAAAIDKNKGKEFIRKSVLLRDGQDGESGALGILRSPDEELTAVFKYTSQGLGHGHYDKLSYSLFHDETEVLQDYGAARWVNIDQKAGGRYLKENTTWAKQTIAHNALVVDQTSHFGGVYDVANLHHSEPLYFNTDNPHLQIAIAQEKNAYDDVDMKRAIIVWTDEAFNEPVCIDILLAESEGSHQYDLPFHYQEQYMISSPSLQASASPTLLGDGHGYQHLYKEAVANIDASSYQFGFFKDKRFYTITSVADENDELIHARLGANDPSFNLRRDALLIHRKKKESNVHFVSVIEPHGSYSPVSEVPSTPYSQLSAIELVHKDDSYIAVTLIDKKENEWLIAFAHQSFEDDTMHEMRIGNDNIKWAGPVTIIKQK